MFRAVALVSGGKDSIFSVLECISQGHEVVALVNMQPPGLKNASVEIDSYMFQSVGTEGIQYLAKALGLPLYQATIKHTAQCCSLNYEASVDDEVEDLFDLLCMVKRKHSDIDAILSGAILSNYQRERVENICERLSWNSLAYLWRRNQKELLLDMIAAGIMARIVKIASYGLDVKRDLGSWISEFLPRAFCLADDPGCSLNPCGEGGEFETFTFDCPLFVKRIVPVESPKVIIHSTDPFSIVAYLRYSGFKLVDKNDDEILVSKEALLSIERPVLVNGNTEHRRPFITNEERCQNLVNSVPSEVLQDISEIRNIDAIFTDRSPKSSSYRTPGICVLPGYLHLTDNCLGLSHKSFKEAVQDAFSKLGSLIENYGSKFDDVIHCHITTNADVSKHDICATIDESFKVLFDSHSARRTRVGNSSPSLVCFSSPWCPDDLKLFENRLAVLSVGTPIVVSISAILTSPEARCMESVETMRVRSVSHWAPAIPFSQHHSQAVRFASQDCFFSGVIGVMPETGELPSTTGLNSDNLPIHVEQQCWFALRHVHRLIMAMERGGWWCLMYAAVYSTGVEILQHAQNQFHATVCAPLTALREMEECFCKTRVVWAVVTALPKSAAVQWQFVTSRRVYHQVDFRSVTVSEDTSVDIDTNSSQLAFLKAGVVTPSVARGMLVVPVKRFLVENLNFACVNFFVRFSVRLYTNMLPLIPRRLEYLLPVVLTRTLRSSTHKLPSSKSLKAVPPNPDVISQITTPNDEFNSPDPSKYCQNLGVKDTVAILQNWLATLDVDRHYPSLPEAGNLAALVPLNDCLRKLVNLGVDLSKIESQPGVANLLVKTDFETSISPKLWLLTDFGFDLSQVARVFTYIPKTIVKSSAEEIASRLKYFTDREFDTGVTVGMISDQPSILAMASCEVDKTLAILMRTFDLRADQVRHVAGGAPKCIVQPIKSTKDVFVALTKMLGFSIAITREMLMDFPRIILSSNRVLSCNTFHLHRRLELPFELIALYPRALCAPPRILAERTNFLKFCSRFQPDGSKPLYTSLDAIIEGTDEEFCKLFADGNEKLFNDYLRTI
ncbi:hypothetical protein Aperf_G00000011552 [Anoplocephala perfoliata]